MQVPALVCARTLLAIHMWQVPALVCGRETLGFMRQQHSTFPYIYV